MFAKQVFLKRQNKGFSLVELVLVIAIVGVVFAIGGSLLTEGFRASYTGIETLRADWQSRVALERMTRELRLIRNPRSLNISVPNQITFIDTSGEMITYRLNGNTLMRNNQSLADGISTLDFTYYNKNRNTITNLAQFALVRFIRIHLVVTEGNMNYSFYTAVNPRNLP